MKKIITVCIALALIATLAGVLTACSPKLDITLDYNGGEFNGNQSVVIGVREGKDVKFGKYKPVREGYDFLYWQDNSGNRYGADEKAQSMQGLTFKAVWSSRLTFTLNEDGSSYIASGTSDNALYMREEIVIPSTYEGKPVSAIADNAFKSCVNVTKIAVPDSVELIGSAAFNGCYKLVELNIPFAGRSASESDGGQYGIAYLFGGRSGSNYGADDTRMPTTLTDITISDAATSIPDWAFGNCKNIKSVKLGENITSIGVRAFQGCRALENINIPSKCNEVAMYAFYNDTAANISVEGALSRVGQYAFYNTKLSKVTLIGGMSSIPMSAFAGTQIEEIVIPQSVTEIGNGAFDGCAKLAKVTILGETLALGSNVFRDCKALNNSGIDLNKLTVKSGVPTSSAQANNPFYGSGVVYSF